MEDINYQNLIDIGFLDPANNGCGCRIEVDPAHELCWYFDRNEVRYQTKGSGFTRVLYCNNISDVKTAFKLLTNKTL